MATTPPAEVEISTALVRRLLEDQHPDLASQVIEPFASGWDNSLFRLGSDLLVRLPRRMVSSGLVVKEQRWLPGIAVRVRVTVPVPVRVGLPTAYYPWPWSISRWITGDLVADLPRSARSVFAEPLAAFLRALGTEAPAGAPANPYRGVRLGERDAAMQERFRSGLIPHPDAAMRLWQRALAQPVWDRDPIWVHGDLHPANLLTVNGGLHAVIDFGDLTAGDPATDLAAAWLIFDHAGRGRFRAAVDARPEIDDATWLRAQGWALNMASAVLVSSDDSPLHRRIGEETIAELLT